MAIIAAIQYASIPVLSVSIDSPVSISHGESTSFQFRLTSNFETTLIFVETNCACSLTDHTPLQIRAGETVFLDASIKSMILRNGSTKTFLFQLVLPAKKIPITTVEFATPVLNRDEVIR